MASKKMTAKVQSKIVERPVVIFTARRGVFFGYTKETNEEIIKRTTATIVRARMCLYWSAATKGALGLAAIGPQAGSKIGPQVGDLTAESITAVVGCTELAATTWEAAPWS